MQPIFNTIAILANLHRLISSTVAMITFGFAFSSPCVSLFAQITAPSTTAGPDRAADRASESSWWLNEPIRFLQTNLSERNSSTDGRKLVAQAAEVGANTLLINMGGIVAQYPTEVPFHYKSEFLGDGYDLFGECIQEAKQRKMRVVGRFDLSKTQKPVYDAHPEWFFRRSNGEPAIYNGLYSTCINGDYYHRHAELILSEALQKYPVDGLFFNMFGNPSRDYSGNPMGNCQCEACQRKFRERFGYALPQQSTSDYRRFMDDSAREVAQNIANLIHRLRPGAAFLTYIQDYTDGIMSESNTSVTRPLPMWLYSASDNTARALGSTRGKMAFNLSISFIDFPWRYATVPQAETSIRLYQAMAHGAPPAIVVSGTMDQEDRRSLVAAKPIFKWHAAHERQYTHQNNAARIVLLQRGSEANYRGMFRILSEAHLPFQVSNNLRFLEESNASVDLIIAPDGAPAELASYIASGGNALIAGAVALPASLPIAKTIARREATQGYWRIHDSAKLPSVTNTRLLMQDGPFIEMAPIEPPMLTLIPPAMFGPPEKVWSDHVESTIPGLIFAEHGKGKVAYIPWNLGELYYRHGTEMHAALAVDMIDRLLPADRQLRTDAHPLVEMTLMNQGDQTQQVHLINLSGHSDTSYHPPIPMSSILISIRGRFSNARALKFDRQLEIAHEAEYSTFVLPRLEEYELIELTKE